MRMEIKTIITDLDDTLLNDSAQISDYTVSVLKRCEKQGMRVIPASGRAIYSMAPYVRRLGTDRSFIACNGAQIADKDMNPIESLELPLDMLNELWDYIHGEGVYMQIYYGDTFYFEQPCQQSKYYERASGMRGVAVGDMHAFLNRGSPKLLCCDEPERIERLYEKTLRLYGNRLCATISKPIFMEMAPLGATKGEALKRLSLMDGFSLESTIAFGDSLNDVSMFECAGHSVAMGNAREETKRAANAVAPSNDQDGVARYLDEYVLGGKL